MCLHVEKAGIERSLPFVLLFVCRLSDIWSPVYGGFFKIYNAYIYSVAAIGIFVQCAGSRACGLSCLVPSGILVPRLRTEPMSPALED